MKTLILLLSRCNVITVYERMRQSLKDETKLIHCWRLPFGRCSSCPAGEQLEPPSESCPEEQVGVSGATSGDRSCCGAPTPEVGVKTSEELSGIPLSL